MVVLILTIIEEEDEYFVYIDKKQGSCLQDIIVLKVHSE